MNTPRVPPRFVPTLTEVVEFEDAQVLDDAAPVPADPAPPAGYAVLDQPLAESLALRQPAADVVVDLAIDAGQMAEAVAAPAGAAEAPPAPVAPAAVVSDDVPAFLLAAQPVPAWTQAREAAPAHVPAVTVVPAVPVAESEVVAPPAALPVSAPPGDALSSEREEQIVQNVLTELQRRTDLMFEYRLREALTPLLARLTDALIKDARHDLAATLRDVVARAVAQELTRHRPK